MSEEKQNTDKTVESAEMVTYDSTKIGLPDKDELNAMWQFAKLMAGTVFCPANLGRDPELLAKNMFGVYIYGRELGMQPLEAAQKCYVTPQGKIGMEGDGLLKLMRDRGVKITFKERTDQKCVIHGKRKDGDEAEGSFTIEEARQAGLTNKKGPWQSYPRRMLYWRAISDLYAQIGTDLFGGIRVYSKDEVDEMTDSYHAQERGSVAEARAAELQVAELSSPAPVETAEVVEESPEETPPFEETPEEETKQEEPAAPPEPEPQTQPPPMPEAAPPPEPPPPPPEPKPEAVSEPEVPADRIKEKATALHEGCLELLQKSGANKTTAQAKLHHFVRGYLGLGAKATLPSDFTPSWIEPLEAAKAKLEQGENVDRQAGVNAAGAIQMNETEKLLRSWGWGDETVQAARDLCVQWDQSADDFVAWVTKNLAVKLNEQSDDDALAFLKTALITRDCFKLARIAKATGRPIKALVAEIHKELIDNGQTPNKATLEKALEVYLELAEGEPEDKQGGLPFSTE